MRSTCDRWRPLRRAEAAAARVVRRRAALTLVALLTWGCEDVDTTIAVWEPPDGGSAPAEPPAPEPTPPAFYFEAEVGRVSGPLEVRDGDDASAGQFVVATAAAEPSDAPGAGRAVYDFELSAAGEYVVWGRLRTRGAEDNRYWLRVDDAPWFLWRMSTGEVWHWDDVHVDRSYGEALLFPLGPGAHRLEVANAVAGAEVDLWYVTGRGDEPSGNTTPCNPPHSIELAGECVRSCGSYGEATCVPDECTGQEHLPVYDCDVCCLVQ